MGIYDKVFNDVCTYRTTSVDTVLEKKSRADDREDDNVPEVSTENGTPQSRGELGSEILEAPTRSSSWLQCLAEFQQMRPGPHFKVSLHAVPKGILGVGTQGGAY